VAQLRAAYGRHVGDLAWTGFIRRMEAASPEFAAMWATQGVAQPASHAKVFRHPLFPRLAMTSTSLAVQAASGTRLGSTPLRRRHPAGHGAAGGGGLAAAAFPLLAGPSGPGAGTRARLGRNMGQTSANHGA